MMFHTGATTASAAVPSGPWYWPTMAVSTMEYIDVIMALPKAADRYLKYMGLMLPFSNFIVHVSFSYAKKPDKEQTSQSVSCPAVISLNNSPSERTRRTIPYSGGNVKPYARPAEKDGFLPGKTLVQ